MTADRESALRALLDALEPIATESALANPDLPAQTVATVSAAISLKRIADRLDDQLNCNTRPAE